MASSLEKLSKNLNKEQFVNLSKYYQGDKLDLLMRKGVYPYDYMDSFDKFDEEELPPKDEFYSKLNDKQITDLDYKHAKKVWKKFKIKNMGEYHDLYLETDVLLLSDVFENFRNILSKITI